MNEKLKDFDMAAILDSNEVIAEYFFQVIEYGDVEELIRAIDYITEAYAVLTRATRNRVAPIASKLAPTQDLCRSQIQCGSEPAREGVSPGNTCLNPSPPPT
jgi:DNA-binding phage protein